MIFSYNYCLNYWTLDKFLEFVLFSLLQLQWVYLINDPLSIVMQYLERSFTILELPLVTVFSTSFREKYLDWNLFD